MAIYERRSKQALLFIAMVVLAGPINELRSMITGYYRTSPGTEPDRNKGDKSNG